MEQDTPTKEEVKVCTNCEGTGLVETMEHVSGDNLIPGGYYEGSGKFERCEEC